MLQLCVFGFDVLDVSIDDLVGLLVGNIGWIKIVIIDQKVIVGIGNVYSDEILYVVKILLFVMVGKLFGVQFICLYEVMVLVLLDVVCWFVGQGVVMFKGEKCFGF